MNRPSIKSLEAKVKKLLNEKDKYIDKASKYLKIASELRDEVSSLKLKNSSLVQEVENLADKLTNSFTDQEYSVVQKQRDALIVESQKLKDVGFKCSLAISVIDAELNSSYKIERSEGSDENGLHYQNEILNGDKRMYRWLKNLRDCFVNARDTSQ